MAERHGVVLSVEDCRLVDLLHKQGRVVIEELRSGLRVQSRSWVGVVHLSSLEVHIVPKLAGGNLCLVDVLAFSSGLDALRRSIGSQHLLAQSEGQLFDLLALQLAQACERIVGDGLLQDYLEEEADLPVLRGRLLADRQLRRRMGQIDRLECRYDERSSNVLENQVLAAALAGCRTCVSHPATGLRIRRLHGLFSVACSLAEFDLASAQEKLTYNRLNQHYREAHELAWLILEGLGITDLFVGGPTRSFAFLLDMNRLFERFVRRLIEHILQGSPYHVHYLRRDCSILWQGDRSYGNVVPDLLVEGSPPGVRRLPVDAKYKLYDEYRLNPGDIYQTFLYAFAYNSPGVEVPEALLIYPASQQGNSLLQLEIRNTAGRPGGQIQALGIHIPLALQEARSNTIGSVSKGLFEALTKPLSYQAVTLETTA